MLIHAMALRKKMDLDMLFDFPSYIKARFAEAEIPEEKSLIELKHFIMGFLILVVGYGSALLALLVELLYKWRH